MPAQNNEPGCFRKVGRSVFSRLFVHLLFAVVLPPAITQADDSQTISVSLPQGDKLAIRLPAGWQQLIIQPSPDLPQTVKIHPPDETLSLQITLVPDINGRFTTKEIVDRVVSEANEQYVSGSVEQRLTLEQIPSTHGHGCYSVFTDAGLAKVAKPAKGQYRIVTTGIFVIGKEAAAFTLLSNDTKSPDYKQALQIIFEEMTVESPSP